MPRNGQGDYELPPSNPVIPGTTIESSWANDTMNDVASALTQSLTADGQTTPVSNLPMGGFHHTGVSDPSLRNQYATLGMTQDGKNTRIQITGGVDNLTGTLVGNSTAYVAGGIYSFFAPANNTGPMTMDYNGIGPKSMVNNQGLPLQATDLVGGKNYLVQYTGTTFQLLSPVSSQAGAIYTQAAVTGWLRPSSGVYPPITLATGTSVNIPAGQGIIVPPGADGADNAYVVSWSASTVTLSYLTSSFSTAIAIDGTGAVAQFAGRIPAADERDYIILGMAIHVNGVATSVVTTPAIFGDNGYLNIDTANMLSNVLISGGEITPSGANLQLNCASGIISQPGGNFSTPNAPNTIPLVGGTPISFRTLAGQGTVGASLMTTAPVTQYDPSGSGVVTALPGNNDCTIHRIYYLFGNFIWVYGQIVYSSISNALNYLEVDRSKYVPSLKLSDATLIAEVISTKANTDLSGVNAAIITRGGAYFSIGNSGGIGEAPVDGKTYGRKDASWAPVVAASTPSVTGDVTITKSNPKVIGVNNPVAAGYSGLNIKQLGFNWCNVEVTNPDDKTYLRSYNPADGVLRNSTTWDLATGDWTFPANVLIPSATSTDTTAGRVLTVGAFGLGVSKGNNAPMLTDWDTLDLSSGIYYLGSSAANKPPMFLATGGGALVVIREWGGNTGGQGELKQLAFDRQGRIAYRISTLDVFSDWVEIWTEKNLVKQTSASDATAGRVLLTGATAAALGADVATTTQLALKANLASPAFTGNPTAPTQAVGNNSTRLATTAFVLANSGCIGDGQTWKDVKSSRALGVTYTNSTGKTISVSVSVSITAVATFSAIITVSGVVVASAVDYSPNTGGTTVCVSAIVPNGATYIIGGTTTAGTRTVSSWAELRA